MPSRELLDPTPERVGRYEIRSRIGQGGMAAVYRAALRGPVDATREVALKVVHPHLSTDEQFVLMFLDEMRLAMALSHRNIVQTFDAGEDDGVFFMVMELVEGCSLHELLRRVGGPLPLEIALFIGLQVCSALEYAHTLDPPVTHRDVSPGNILISTGGDVKLADFGVAKAAGRMVVSSSNVLKGKVTYMSPEQARGHAGPPADIFALGAVLYEMICGARIRPSSELEWIINNTAVPAILSQVRPEIPASLEQLVMSCVASEVGQRPAGAAALHEALNQELFGLLSATGKAVDSHRRLCAFLEQWIERPAPEPQAPTREALLARKLIEEAASEEETASLLASARDDDQRHTVAAPAGPEPALEDEQPAERPTTVSDTPAGRERSPARSVSWIVPVGVAGLVLALVAVALVGYLWQRIVPDGRHATTVQDQGSRDGQRAVDSRPTALADATTATPDLRQAPDLDRPERQRDSRPRPRPAPPRKAELWVLARIEGQVVWADVLIDGRRVGQSPVRVPRLDPGEHVIEVHRDGYPPAKRRVRLRPGQSLKVFVELVQ